MNLPWLNKKNHASCQALVGNSYGAANQHPRRDYWQIGAWLKHDDSKKCPWKGQSDWLKLA